MDGYYGLQPALPTLRCRPNGNLRCFSQWLNVSCCVLELLYTLARMSRIQENKKIVVIVRCCISFHCGHYMTPEHRPIGALGASYAGVLLKHIPVYFFRISVFGVSWTSWGHKISGRHDWS